MGVKCEAPEICTTQGKSVFLCVCGGTSGLVSHSALPSNVLVAI